MNTNFKIYQLNNSKEARNIKFMNYEFLVENKINLSLNLYNEVYAGEVGGRDEFYDNTPELCDYLFHKFNMNRPADFKGHSLSTSDIIEIEGKYYYCDDYGWKKVDMEAKPKKTYKRVQMTECQGGLKYATIYEVRGEREGERRTIARFFSKEEAERTAESYREGIYESTWVMEEMVWG
jgi:hypothetical protein